MGNNNHIAYLLATYLQWNYNIENMTISVKFIKNFIKNPNYSYSVKNRIIQ